MCKRKWHCKGERVMLYKRHSSEVAKANGWGYNCVGMTMQWYRNKKWKDERTKTLRQRGKGAKTKRSCKDKVAKTRVQSSKDKGAELKRQRRKQSCEDKEAKLRGKERRCNYNREQIKVTKEWSWKRQRVKLHKLCSRGIKKQASKCRSQFVVIFYRFCVWKLYYHTNMLSTKKLN